MAKRKVPLEKTYYPIVARWLTRHFKCFKIAVNKGLRYGRIDVLGIRDIGGDLSGEVETIAVEVKRGTSSFANSCGQAFGYSVYANRVYFADVRETGFNQDEIFIASNLGIGLIHIKRKTCSEILSSPFYRPVTRMQLNLFETLRLGRCQICDSIFQIEGLRGEHVASEGVSQHQTCDRGGEVGLMFWNSEVGERKRRLGIRVSKEEGLSFERRYLCPDCVGTVLRPLHPDR